VHQSDDYCLEKQFVLRNENDHKGYCKLVEADKSGALSKEFGINRDSVLNELELFMCVMGPSTGHQA